MDTTSRSNLGREGERINQPAPAYYGAYVLDPDGNDVEAACHEPA